MTRVNTTRWTTPPSTRNSSPTFSQHLDGLAAPSPRPRRRHRPNPDRTRPPRTPYCTSPPSTPPPACSPSPARTSPPQISPTASTQFSPTPSICHSPTTHSPSSSATASSTTSPSHKQSSPKRFASPARGGLLFHRDLARPSDEAELQHLVETYAGNATPYQRKLFADSLRAALTLEEVARSCRDLRLRSQHRPNDVRPPLDVACSDFRILISISRFCSLACWP